MVKVNLLTNCGNEPKKILLRDFTIAIVNNDLPIIFNNVIDEVEWKLVKIGRETAIGKSEIKNTLSEWFDISFAEMNITDVDIDTNGEVGFTKGIIITVDSEIYSFSNVYLFTSNDKRDKIKNIVTFIIKGRLDGPNSWGQFPSNTKF